MYENYEPITPSDSTDLVFPLRGFHLAVAGNVKVKKVNGADVTLTGLTAGYHWLACKRIYATDTTATGITGVY